MERRRRPAEGNAVSWVVALLVMVTAVAVVVAIVVVVP